MSEPVVLTQRELAEAIDRLVAPWKAQALEAQAKLGEYHDLVRALRRRIDELEAEKDLLADELYRARHP